MQTAQSLEKPKIGRPTKYNDDLLRKTADYLENYRDTGDLIPSVAGLAQVLDTRRETLHVWAKDKNKKVFSNMLLQLMEAQERSLLNGGLSSTFNPSITKLVLSKHGYTDNPQANQGNSGITVNVNRGGVTVQAGGQSVSVSTDQDDTGREPVTIEHE